jgi:uncharacterized protein YndB with AHSA1/START domain
LTTERSAVDITFPSDREISMTRVFDAPRELVWKAWTERDRVVEWWGQDGFTTTVREMDVQPGGGWCFVMHGPDGTDYDVNAVFIEVVKPERLVYDHDEPPFRVTVTFDEDGGGTRITMRSLFASTKERDRVYEDGAREGGPQMFERLREYLARTTSSHMTSRNRQINGGT